MMSKPQDKNNLDDEQPRHPVNLCYCCACWVPLENDKRFGNCTSSPPVVVVKNGSTVTRYPVTGKTDGCNTGFVKRQLQHPVREPTLWELSERILHKPRPKASPPRKSRPSPANLADLMGRDPKASSKPWRHDDSLISEMHPPLTTTIGADEILEKLIR